MEKLVKGQIGEKSLLSLKPSGALLLELCANYGLAKPILRSLQSFCQITGGRAIRKGHDEKDSSTLSGLEM